MDVSQYLEIFIDESNEHLQSLSDQLMILEKEPENSDTINEIFRAAHSLKGMAGTMGYKRMQNLTHDMENVFSEVRNGNMKVTSDLVDVLFQCLDALEEYVNNIQETQDEGTNDNEPIIKALNAFIASENKDAAPAEEKQEQQAESAPAEKLQADEHGISMELADFEKNAVNEALKKGMHVYEIKVTVDENCILKAARAFLVFKNLEGHGDIIKSDPSVQDIEDEKFDFDFQIVILTEESFDDIIKIIKNVSEIKDADGEEITKAFPEEKTEEEKKASLKETNEYEKTASYIAEIVKGLGLPECSVKTFADDEEIVFELDCGDDYGIVIGRRGETLDAIQYLARMVANRGVSGYKRVSINIGNYREKRKGALVSLAKKDAARAVRTGRNITLEPMNPYERRIIHTAVQEVEGATSFSVGQDLDRRVVIAPENGGKGSYGDRNYRRGRGGRNDRRPKREPYVPQVAPDREQKNDAAGVSVYGKIEIKKNTEE